MSVRPSGLPRQTRAAAVVIAFLLGLFSLLRLLFFVHNRAVFAGGDLAGLAFSFLHGLRFDLAAALLLAGPPLLLLHLPGRWKEKGRRAEILLLSPLPFVWAAMALHSADLLYYADSGRRLSFEVFLLLREPREVGGMVLAYRGTLAAAIAACAALAWAWRRVALAAWRGGRSEAGRVAALLWLVAYLAGGVIGFRGGLQPKPLRPSHAFRTGRTAEGHLALNPVFTVFYAFKRGEAPVKRHFPDAEAAKIVRGVLGVGEHEVRDPRFPLERSSPAPEVPARKLNVVVLLLEGWPARYVGSLGGSPAVTPEFDRLASEGILFTDAHAVGLRSADGVAATGCGVPTFEDLQVIGGALEQDRLRCLGTVFGDAGYATLFLHGARTGSLGLDAFSRIMGFSRYIGMEDIAPAAGDYDPVWGTYDAVALDRLAVELGGMPEPFAAFWFSLTSHSPYRLPAGFSRAVPAGATDREFLETLRYSDAALGRFFARVRGEPWFRDTVFLLVADHTAGSGLTGPQDRARIPLLVYAPGRIGPERRGEAAGQLDVLPTLLDLAGVRIRHHSFGRSLMRPGPRSSFSDLYGNLLWARDGWLLSADAEGKGNLFRRAAGRLEPVSDEKEADVLRKELLAFVQTGRTLLKENRLSAPSER